MALLTLACACTACSASAPPPDDAGNAPSEPATATPSTNPPSAAAGSETPAAETAAPATPAPEPTAAPEPVTETSPPLPKPRPITISKTPVKPTPSPTLPAAGVKEAATHITINALSRGKGVPAETREAFKQIRALLERQQASTAVTALQYQRIGLEGESRLCVEFRNASDAQAALAEIRKIAADVDLLNVVEASCPSNKE
jgi:hypothetical protein